MTAEPQGAGADVSKADLVHRRLKEEIELGELAPGTPAAAASARRSATDRSGRSTPPAARFAASARSSTSPG